MERLSAKVKYVFAMLLVSTIVIVAGCGGSQPAATSAPSNSPANNTATATQPKQPKAAPQKQEKPIELVHNVVLPSTHHASVNVYAPWEKTVEEKTNGRIDVTTLYGAALGPINTVWEDVGNGVYDVGLIFVGMYGDSPWLPFTVVDNPFVVPDVTTAHESLKKYTEKYYKEDVFPDVKLLGLTVTDMNMLWSREPIKTLDEMKGKKIMVRTDMEAAIVSSWGANPVSMSTADQYQSLERNIVDGLIGSVAHGMGIGLQEVAPFILDLGVNTSSVGYIMNKDYYNGLPDDLKAQFDNELSDLLPTGLLESYRSASDGYMEKFKAEGGTLVELTSEERSKFRSAGEALWSKWVENVTAKGFPGEQMFKDFNEIVGN